MKRSTEICPCCQQPRSYLEAKKALVQYATLFHKEPLLKKMLGKENYKRLLEGNYSWACDQCLAQTKAIKANVSKQNYRSSPRLAYWCTEHNCTKCSRSYLFRKTEKKYWFEDLHLFVDAEPNACQECRRNIRHQKNRNQELSDLLRNGATVLAATQLERVIEIYTEWGKQEKANYFARLLKRVKR